MVAQARQTDRECVYLRVLDGDVGAMEAARYDRIMGRLLKPGGRLLSLVSAEARYGRDWASFLTASFPENRAPRTGDPVFTVMKDIPDARPISDIFCAEGDDLALPAGCSPMPPWGGPRNPSSG